ncbi:MAG: type I methionyl aminopeptidase [Oscillospiraceae bacterium]|nr:type I methionyl aminopeptidase [Oscillospiraceae bacterium]
MVTIKGERELALMREAGAIIARLFERLEGEVAPGVTTMRLDMLAERLITESGGKPSFKGYPGAKGAKPFPGSICASVNAQVIHGIPDGRRLREGDILSVDVGVSVGGYHTDAARTYAVGEVSPAAAKIISVARECFYKGLGKAVAGNRVSDISGAVEDHAGANGFSVVRDWMGHGIGRLLHEKPEIPNFRVMARGARLSEGMTICIEPMINGGTAEVLIGDDEWSVVTKDGSLSAHYENTVLIKAGESEIIT